MGRKSRSVSDRTHKHTNFSEAVKSLDEEDLFQLIEKSDRQAFLLVLDNVQDPHNLGACLRTANGAGVQAVVVPKDRAVSITPAVRTVACGAAEKTPLVRVTNLARCLDRLKEAGVWLVGTADQAEKSLYQIDLTGPLAIVVGSEGTGIRRLTSDKCDFLARLPMAGDVESLNVSVATGVCLYEAVRQRTSKG